MLWFLNFTVYCCYALLSLFDVVTFWEPQVDRGITFTWDELAKKRSLKILPSFYSRISSTVNSKRHQWAPKFPLIFTFQLGSSEPVILCGSSRNKDTVEALTETETPRRLFFPPRKVVASNWDAVAPSGNCFRSRGSTTSCYSPANANRARCHVWHGMEFAERIFFLFCPILFYGEARACANVCEGH